MEMLKEERESVCEEKDLNCQKRNIIFLKKNAREKVVFFFEKKVI